MPNPLFLLAKRYIAGETLDDALARVKELNSKGLHVILDKLGEDVNSSIEASKHAQESIRILEEIHKKGVSCYLALKLTSIGLCVSEKLCYKNAEAIIKKAMQCNNNVVIDMERSQYVASTLRIYFQLYKKYNNVGVCIQSYLKRTEADAKKLAKARAIVRLVKGAYKELPSISFQNKADVDINYSKCLSILFKGCKEVHVGTHDEKMIDEAILLADMTKTPYELQMLMGIRDNLKEKLAAGGHKVRVYVPFGKDWMGYVYRRFRERKENWMFVMKNLFK